MLFRVLIFILLVIIGYYLSRKVRTNKVSATLVGIFLLLVLAGFFLMSKRIFALFSFSFYLVIILGGLIIGFLAGFYKHRTSGE